MDTRIQLYAQVGGTLLPIGSAASARAVIASVRNAPDIEAAGDTQLAEVEHHYAAQLARRVLSGPRDIRGSVPAGSTGE